MAGRGPAPKPPEQRRRRNKPAEVQELPADARPATSPTLPKTYRLEVDGKTKQVPYLKVARDWYTEWARSPMAVEFTGVHWRRLALLARVVDRFERTADLELLKEIRLQEAGFGGTPYDLRRLGKKIAQPIDDPAGAEPEQPARGESKAARDRRLRLVSG